MNLEDLINLEIRIKPWEEIKKTLNYGDCHKVSALYFVDAMKDYTGKVIKQFQPHDHPRWLTAVGWIWDEDWLDIPEGYYVKERILEELNG